MSGTNLWTKLSSCDKGALCDFLSGGPDGGRNELLLPLRCAVATTDILIDFSIIVAQVTRFHYSLKREQWYVHTQSLLWQAYCAQTADTGFSNHATRCYLPPSRQ